MRCMHDAMSLIGCMSSPISITHEPRWRKVGGPTSRRVFFVQATVNPELDGVLPLLGNRGVYVLLVRPRLAGDQHAACENWAFTETRSTGCAVQAATDPLVVCDFALVQQPLGRRDAREWMTPIV